MATHSRVLAWRIPGTGEPGGLPSMGSHRVGHDWSNLAAAAAVCRKPERKSTCYKMLIRLLLACSSNRELEPDWLWLPGGHCVKNPKSKLEQKMACQQRGLRFRVSLFRPITFSFTSHYSWASTLLITHQAAGYDRHHFWSACGLKGAVKYHTTV